MADEHRGDGLFMVRPSEIDHVEPDGSRWKIEIEWGLVRGRAEPTSIKIAPWFPSVVEVLERFDHAWVDRQRVLSASAIRRLPVGTLIADARVAAEQQMRGLVDHMEANDFVTPSEAAATRAHWGPHRGRPSHPDELQLVADAYLDAWRIGAPVTRAVAAACGVSESTAGKRIMKARRAGLLPKEGIQ